MITKKQIYCVIAILFVSSMFSFTNAQSNMQTSAQPNMQTNVQPNMQTSTQSNVMPAQIALEAQSAIVMDKESNRVLYEKDIHSQRSMASLTKIMTCIVALENGNLNDIVIVSEQAANIGGSGIKLKENDEVKLEELLYGLMLKSGNDAAIAIAEHIGGSYDQFVQMMNDKATALELVNTSFANPHGLDHDDHFSSAYDLARLSAYALQNPKFAQIVSTKEIHFPKFYFSNTNELLFSYPNATGIKTGYTGNAGRCLVTSAQYGETTLISVVLQCNTRNQRAASSKKILNYASAEFERRVLMEENAFIGDVAVIKGRTAFVHAKTKEQVVYPLSDAEMERLEKHMVFLQERRAPVQQGEIVGEIGFYLDSERIGGTEIYLTDTIMKKNVMDFFVEIWRSWFAFLLG